MFGQTWYESVRNGDWTDSTTWNGSGYPNVNSSVDIYHNVTLSSVTGVRDVYIDGSGQLTLNSNASLAVNYDPLWADFGNLGTLNITDSAALVLAGAEGYFYNEGTATLSGSASVIAEGNYWASSENDGVMDIRDSAKVVITADDVEFANYGNGILRIGDTAAVEIMAYSANVYNEGTMTINGSTFLAVESDMVRFDNDGVLNIGGSAEVVIEGVAGIGENWGTLNITDSASVSIEFTAGLFHNYGTITINGSASLMAPALENNGGEIVLNNSDNRLSILFLGNGEGGEVKLNNSSITIFGLSNTDSGYEGSRIELANSHISILDVGSGDPLAKFVNEGDVKLGGNSSLSIDSGVMAQFGINSRFQIGGANNFLRAGDMKGMGEWQSGAYIPNTVFRVQGTDAATDFVDINTKVSFADTATWNSVTDEYDYTYNGKGDLEFRNVEARLSSVVYTNINEAHFHDAVVAGLGDTNVDFFFYGTASGIKPGSSPGVFYGNSFTFDGSTIYIEVGSDDFDRIVASGDITFTGANNVVLINFDNTDQTFTLSFDDIFQAGGDVTVGGDELADTTVRTVGGENEIQIVGEEGYVAFQSATNSDGGAQFVFGEVEVDPETGNVVFGVTGQKEEEPPLPSPVSRNVRTLMQVHNKMFFKGGNELSDWLGYYATLGWDDYVEVLNELDPVALSLADVFVQNAVATFNRTNFDRLRFLQASNRKKGKNFHGQDPCEAVCGSKFDREIWFQSIADWARQEKTEIEGYTADTYGFALGMDSQISNRTVLGVGFGGMFTKAVTQNGFGNVKADSYLLSLYGLHKMERFSVSGTVGYAFSNLDSLRYAPHVGGIAHGKRDAGTFFAGAELAYRFGNRDGYFTPFVAYDYVGYSEDAFREVGYLINMNVTKKETTGHLQTVGVRLGREIKTRRDRVFTPELTAGWLHDYGVGSVRTAGVFAIDPGVPFVVDGVSRNTDRALLGAKINVALSSQANLFFRYDGEWAKSYNSQYVSAGFGLLF